MRPSDVIWRNRSWSTLLQMVSSCLAAPIHYRKLGWSHIIKVPYHSPKSSFKPSRCLTQCWNTIILNISNAIQWNLKRNSYIFIQENAFENIVCEMAFILSRPQYFKTWQMRQQKLPACLIGIGDIFSRWQSRCVDRHSALSCQAQLMLVPVNNH